MAFRESWPAVRWLSAALLLLVAGWTSAQPKGNVSPTSPYKAIAEKLRATIQRQVREKNLPAFSIALVDGDQMVWAEGFSYRDKDRKQKATAETVYRVGSVSKLFTDLAMMKLVNEGTIDLDAPLKKYLPEIKPRNSFGVPITLRQIMSHRSGLVRESPVGHYFDPDEPSLRDTVLSLNGTSLVYKPGSRTKYSNAGIAVVGYLLEKQVKREFSKHMYLTVLQPLSAKSSGFQLTPALKRQLATGWMWTYDGRRFAAPGFGLGTAPAGNLYASMTDLSRFMIAVLNKGKYQDRQIIDPKALRLMIRPPKNGDFAIGFRNAKLDGQRQIGHGGAVYGFSTQFEALPEHRLGVSASVALDGANGWVRRITDYALRLMLAQRRGKPLPDFAHTTPATPERGREIRGHYRGGDEFVQVIERSNKLWLRSGTVLSRVRNTPKGTMVVDDVLGYGPEIRPSGSQLLIDRTRFRRQSDSPPPDLARPAWKGLIGEYGWDHNVLYILEDRGQLFALIEWFFHYPLRQIDENTFAFPNYGLYHGEKLFFSRGQDGRAKHVVAAEVKFERREVGTKDGETFRIQPVRPIRELRGIALKAKPPREIGEFRAAELVDLTKLDPTIKLDIRYATTNNFTGSVFYQQPRAFMQRPAAEAVVRAHQRLKPKGLGLLIHDAYRPWHVTKMFWDATPQSMKDFVANPANGSRHNRGCAVDLTLYDLKSGKPIQMVAGYDEFSPRSFPGYPGGTSRQRYYRELLRRTMEAEAFSVYEFEWWHFDFKDWRNYRIGNKTFEQLK